jgi:hypothetical protein
MSKTVVWTVTVTIAVAVFAIILVVGRQMTDEDPKWLIPLAAAAFGACVAIGNTIVSLRFRSAPSGAEPTAAAAQSTQTSSHDLPTHQPPTDQAPPSQQTGTTFATGGSIAGINAGRDVTIGMPSQDNTTTPKQPDEGA